MEDYKSIDILLEANLKLMKLTNEELTEVKGQMQDVPYNTSMDLLMYAIVGTKVDLEYVVSIVSLYILKTSPIHLITIKNFIIYLKSTLHFKSCLESGNITLHDYCNADWTRDANDRRSRRKYVFFIRK